jgi:hypothetical protein
LNTIDRIRFFIEDHPWGVTGTLAALLVVAAMGWWFTANDSEDSDLEKQLAAARHKAASLRNRLEKLTTQGDEAIDPAQAAGARAEGKATSGRSSGKAARGQGEQALDRHAQAPDQPGQESTPATQTVNSRPLPDGIWRFGSDYGAGHYRAPGGEGCYWSTLSDANPRHIIDYDVSAKHPTVELGPETPFFKTVHCGKWLKVG